MRQGHINLLQRKEIVRVVVILSILNVNFMQSSIKNQTGEHTVLGNAEALKSGALKATDLPEIRIW